MKRCVQLDKLFKPMLLIPKLSSGLKNQFNLCCQGRIRFLNMLDTSENFVEFVSQNLVWISVPILGLINVPLLETL